MHSITGVFFYEKNIKKTIDKRKTMCYNKGELKEKECKKMADLRQEQEELFKKLIQLNVNEHTELKNDLTYLSWAFAWQEFLKVCPDATYDIEHFADKDGIMRCYQYDANLGYMVFTNITARGLTRRMWLPVMDGANKAMKAEPYTYTVGKGDKAFKKTVESATMFDINKTIMRCLVKNIAMFGLGLYIYAGEDLPIELGEPMTAKQKAKFEELQIIVPNVLKKFRVSSIDDLTYQQAEFVINAKEKSLEGSKK